MKTTFDLPNDLMAEAVAVRGGDTKTATIIYALQQLIRFDKLSKLRAMRGSMPDFAIDLDATRSRR